MTISMYLSKPQLHKLLVYKQLQLCVTALLILKHRGFFKVKLLVAFPAVFCSQHLVNFKILKYIFFLTCSCTVLNTTASQLRGKKAFKISDWKVYLLGTKGGGKVIKHLIFSKYKTDQQLDSKVINIKYSRETQKNCKTNSQCIC